jgi:hypothetical protein
VTKADRQVESAAFDVAEDIIQHTETAAASGNDVMNSWLHPCKQTRLSAADREMKVETLARL